MTRVYVDPTPFDVLCGRGKACFDHLGNQRFRQIIEQTLPKYSKAKTKGEKTFFVRLVVNHIAVQGGRFLKLDRETNRWYEGDAICAKSKVGHAFRDAKETRSNLPEGVESLLLLQKAVAGKEDKDAEHDEQDGENDDSSRKDGDDSHRERLKNLKVLKDSMDGKTFAMPLEDLPDVTDLASIKQAMMRTLLQRQQSGKDTVSPRTPGSTILAPKSPARVTPGSSLASPGLPLSGTSPLFGKLKQAMMRTLVLRQQALNERPSKTEILRRAIQAQQNAQTLQQSPVQILSDAIKVQQNASRKRNLTPDALRHIQSQMVVQGPSAKKRRMESAAEQWSKHATTQKANSSKMFFM